VFCVPVSFLSVCAELDFSVFRGLLLLHLVLLLRLVLLLHLGVWLCLSFGLLLLPLLVFVLLSPIFQRMGVLLFPLRVLLVHLPVLLQLRWVSRPPQLGVRVLPLVVFVLVCFRRGSPSAIVSALFAC
jgi:hypothetical protein